MSSVQPAPRAQGPHPIGSATGLFIAATILALIWFHVYYQKGRISKDNFQTITVVVVTMAVSTWLMWLCCWMHQWHPLIYPTWVMKAELATD